MERHRTSLVVTFLLALALAAAGCGGGDPDPSTVLDRALTRTNLASFGAGSGGTGGGVVAVEALGYGDRVLQERRVEAGPKVMSAIRGALGSSDSGLRPLVGDLELEGVEEVGGVETDHVSGSLEVAGLARALDDAGAGGVGSLAGTGGGADLEGSLSAAEFDLYAGEDDGVIRRLDLTLALDDPDNALPPTRIRFSLTPDASSANP